MKPLAFALLLLSAAAQATQVEFDTEANRLLISASTITSNLAASDVAALPGNGTAGNVRMYYDSTDTYTGYAAKPNYWNQDWSAYIQPGSALGPLGPLGYSGPLSAVGPLKGYSYSWGSISWFPTNYSAWVGFYIWNGSANFGSANPYGASGPLGYSGPLTEKALYRDMPHLNETMDGVQEAGSDYNDFPHELDPSGVWGILGPAGPLGALGPLGPLGKLGYGSSGNVTVSASSGDFQVNGQTKRSLMVQYDNNSPATYRIYDFSEVYPHDNLITRQANPSANGFVNDTSFSVDAVSSGCTLSYASAQNHTYYFQAKSDQFVSLVLTNANAYAELNFDVYIKADASGTFKNATDAATWFGSTPLKFSVATISALWNNTAVGYQDFAVFRAKKNDVIKVVVKAPYGTAYDSCGYFLHVTGTGFQTQVGSGAASDSTLFSPRRVSTAGFKTFNITGVHQQALSW
jgi:hypothetical protein